MKLLWTLAVVAVVCSILTECAHAGERAAAYGPAKYVIAPLPPAERSAIPIYRARLYAKFKHCGPNEDILLLEVEHRAGLTGVRCGDALFEVLPGYGLAKPVTMRQLQLDTEAAIDRFEFNFK